MTTAELNAVAICISLFVGQAGIAWIMSLYVDLKAGRSTKDVIEFLQDSDSD